MGNRDTDHLRLSLIQQILNLPIAQLSEAADFMTRLTTNAELLPLHSSLAAPLAPTTPAERDWPHAPLHRLSEQGTYLVTASTYEKEHYFRGVERLNFLESKLLSLAKTFGWQLEAWAVFSNHYHFVAHSPPLAESLSALLKDLHYQTACHVNKLDQLPARQVWFNFWETHLTFEKSYLARLSYVHRNPVKHGLVSHPAQYRWCSAAWLERTLSRAQVETMYRFKIDRINIQDDFAPL